MTYKMDQTTPMDGVLCALSMLSAVCSLFVVISYLTFEDLRKLRFLEFIFYVSLNDFIASFSLGLFAVQRGLVECFLQGFFTNFNYVSSAFWTVIITYQLYLVVSRGKIISNIMYFHIAGWILPLVAALLPLTTNTYGQTFDDGNETRDSVHWCFIASTHRSFRGSEFLWEVLSFYLWIWLAILFMLYIVIYVNVKVNSMQFVSESLQSSVRKLYFYPVIFIVSWILPSICDIYSSTQFGRGETNSLNPTLVVIANFFPALQGFLLFVVVIWKNPLIRECWAARLSMWTKQVAGLRICSRSGLASDDEIRDDEDRRGLGRDSAAAVSEYQNQIKVIHSKIELEADHITNNSSKSLIDTMRDSFDAIKYSIGGKGVPEQFTDVKLSAMYEMSTKNSSAAPIKGSKKSNNEKIANANETSGWNKYADESTNDPEV